MSSPKLSPPAGSTKTPKRLGRGRGSGLGKTSGRGTKGHGSRSGFKKRAWFEGGQMPLQRRVPKVGFKPIDRDVYQVVNLSAMEECPAGSTIAPKDMALAGWIKNPNALVKVLANGDFSKKLSIQAHAFSKSATAKIQAAGGNAVVMPRFVSSSQSKGEKSS